MTHPDVVLDRAVAPEPPTATTSLFPQYCFPEFTGSGGERALKKVLRQILPAALYRTWEICAEHQARGSVCYLGLVRLATVAGRSIRTMQRDLAALQARGLLLERAERRVLVERDSTPVSRLVLVKDFTPLYQLAHVYHEWMQGPEMIPPDRAFLPLLLDDPTLLASLLRFDNYRRVLAPHLPQATDGMADATDRERSAHASVSSVPAKTAAALTSIAGAKVSPKRILESSSRKTTQQDSFESIDSIPPSSNQAERCRLPDSQKIRTLPVPVLPSADAPCLPATAEREGFPNVDASTYQATYSVTTATALPMRDTSGQSHPSSVPDHPLARSFLAAIAEPFGDRNPKGSVTRVRRLLAQAGLSDGDVVLCLGRAAAVARQTQTLRPAHYDPNTGQANRMPLFCALLERFVQARVQRQPWVYSWQQLETDLASDACLAAWWCACPCREALTLPDAAPEQEALEAEDPSPREDVALTPAAREAWERWHTRRMHLSQTQAQQEARAARAHQVIRQCSRRAIALESPMVLWEHVQCGCPLYHRSRGREVCAYCVPDPAWPQEVLQMLQALVADEPVKGEPVAQEQTEEDACGWSDPAEAQAVAEEVDRVLTECGYRVEVYLEPIETGLHVIIRGADGELVCRDPGHIAWVLDLARQHAL